ncbi:DUF2785 domain-containing protein [Rummeliibacillus pycnus]|uniref:DUF2785 domain-containing protein n=1 Tax=Rummeliibacillus pycnus TaxID=101070 RepID=UPI003D2C83B3
MDEITLKKYLSDIQNGESTWNDYDQQEILDAMMECIGSPDPELRDELIYRQFSQIIDIDDQLSDDVLVDLLTRALGDEYLFYEIGDVETDHIFKRSYSVLLIALILSKDLEKSFISLPLLDKVRAELLLYLDLEQDLRGFIPEKGWAHSVAHTADAMNELVKNPKMDVNYFPALYQGLANKVFTFTDVYVTDEEERILSPIMSMLEIGLSSEIVEELFTKIPAFLIQQKNKINEEKYLKLYANCKSFLKSFYICTSSNEKWKSIQQRIGRCLDEI